MNDDSGNRNFEAAFNQLEALVARLESGGLGLDETMDLYEAGMRLVHECTHRIATAELRLTRLQELTAQDLVPED